jgi:hypothetical protein
MLEAPTVQAATASFRLSHAHIQPSSTTTKTASNSKTPWRVLKGVILFVNLMASQAGIKGV